LRHLEFERKEEHFDKLNIFLKESLGKNYNLNIFDLMKRKKTQKMPRSDSTFVDEERSFFCSELIAKCYKSCGIIKDGDYACTNFLPCNFTSNDFTLPLVDKITVENEKNILKHD
jgi:hypothetical protein